MNSILSRLARRAAHAALAASVASSAWGAERVLYQFQPGTDGQEPTGNLVADVQGNLYGTTIAGGAHNLGTVFRLTPGGSETIVYSFKGGTDAAAPGGLTMDSAGNLYGRSMSSGAYGYGTVFKIAPDGTESVLYAFQDGTDGGYPSGKLLLDQKGNIYGTTEIGGDPSCQLFNNDDQCGSVFEITANGREKILHSFESGTDGAVPYGGVMADSAGNLYGTTAYGGAIQNQNCGGVGCGTIFEVKPNGQEKILYAFQGGADADEPYTGLVADSQGNLYGAATDGCTSTFGCIFKLTPDGTESILFKFTKNSQGLWPQQDLIIDSNDNLFGLTEFGGVGHCFGRYWGCGIAFEISPEGEETVLYTFHARSHGRSPDASLFMGSNGVMYGTAFNGGACLKCGVVFSLTK